MAAALSIIRPNLGRHPCLLSLKAMTDSLPERDFRRIQDAISGIRTEEDLERVLKLIREWAVRYPEARSYAESAVMHAGCHGVGPAARP